jgi:hypothetical protein
MGQAGVSNVMVQEGDRGRPEDEQAAREQAKRTYTHGVAVTKEVVNGIRLGRTTNIKKAKRAVQMIVDQVLTNETSIIGLTTLRDYDEYTFTHSVNVCIFAVALGRKIDLPSSLYDLSSQLRQRRQARVDRDPGQADHWTDDEWQALRTHTWWGA